MNLETEYSRTPRTVILIKCENVWPIHLIKRNTTMLKIKIRLRDKERATINENIFTEELE